MGSGRLPFFWGVLGGCLAGVFSAGLAWALITFVLKPFVGMTGSVVDQTVGSGAVGGQVVAPGVLAAWVIVAAVAVVGVGVAAIVGEKLVARQIYSAKLHVHVDLYRDIIEAQRAQGMSEVRDRMIGDDEQRNRGAKWRISMKVTDRETMAYGIRRDAALAQAWIAEVSAGPDTPQRPGRIAAARQFADWCNSANSELLDNPGLDLEDARARWSLAAAASEIRLRPYEIPTFVACFASLLIGVTAALRVDNWWYLIAGVVVAVSMYVLFNCLAPRLVVGPYAHRDASAALLLDVEARRRS